MHKAPFIFMTPMDFAVLAALPTQLPEVMCITTDLLMDALYVT
jgi:hypothetical protein